MIVGGSVKNEENDRKKEIELIKKRNFISSSGLQASILNKKWFKQLCEGVVLVKRKKNFH